MPYALLVDDDRPIRAQHRATLRSDGWEVAEYDDAASALAAMRDRRPDVVLLALHPPRSDGLHLLQEMLTDAELRAIPRVVISGGADAVERALALGLGGAAWLASPVTPERLLAAAWDHRSDVDVSVDDVEPVPPAT